VSDANRIPAVLRAKATEDWRPATLALGEPRDSSPGAIAAQVALTDDGPESRFLFRFTRERGWVFRSGFASHGLLDPVPAGEQGAVGGI